MSGFQQNLISYNPQSLNHVLIPTHIAIKGIYGVVYVMGPIMCWVLGLLKAPLCVIASGFPTPQHEGRFGS